MKLLVAIDGSEHALRALRSGLALAARCSEPTEVVIANVHDDAALLGAGSFVGHEALNAYLDELARSETAAAEALCTDAQVAYQTCLLRGPIATTLAQAATAQHCDLLVLGSKGRNALKDLLLGSVAQRLAALSNTPLLMVR